MADLGSTNRRDDLAAAAKLKWDADATERANVDTLLGDDPHAELAITFQNPASAGEVTPYSIAVIKKVMLLSGVKAIQISSVYRSPEDQGRVMFDNLEQGKRIRYKGPGRAVTEQYDKAKRASRTPTDTLRLMVDEIYYLGPESVSKHASPPGWLNVVDIRPSSIAIKHRSKFVDAVTRLVPRYISTFLHPGNSKDPAYHLEIPQGKTLVIKAMARQGRT